MKTTYHPDLQLGYEHLRLTQEYMIKSMLGQAKLSRELGDWTYIAQILCMRMYITLEDIQRKDNNSRLMNRRYALILALIDMGIDEYLLPDLLKRERTTARNYSVVNARNWASNPDIQSLYKLIIVK